MYLMFGLSATSQEMLSTAQGAELTLLNVIGVVLYIISKTPPGLLHIYPVPIPSSGDMYIWGGGVTSSGDIINEAK